MLITLFSDASLCHETRSGGWAAWLKSDRGALRAGAPFTIQVHETCIAEAMAVVNGMTCGIRDGLIAPGDAILVQTDNNAVMDILQGTARRRATKAVKRRRKLSWSALKADVRERNHEIDAVATAFSSMVSRLGLRIMWRHVKGHMGRIDARSAVNTYCDGIARTHMRRARKMEIPPLSIRTAMRRPAAIPATA